MRKLKPERLNDLPKALARQSWDSNSGLLAPESKILAITLLRLFESHFIKDYNLALAPHDFTSYHSLTH